MPVVKAGDSRFVEGDVKRGGASTRHPADVRHVWSESDKSY